MLKVNLKIGDIVVSPGCDQTIVLDVQGRDALLFTGMQFIHAHEFKLENKNISWNYGTYYTSFDQVPKNYEIMEFDDFKNHVACMMKASDHNMVKSLIAVENHVNEPELLNVMYQRFEQEKFNLLNNYFDEIHAKLTQEDDFLSEDDWEPEL